MVESPKGPIRGKQKKSDGETYTPIFDPDQYDAHKSAVAISMGHFFLRYLNLLYREFEGDLVLPIVLGEIAHHNIIRLHSGKGDSIEVRERALNSPEWMENLEPTNAFSISQATGIPRETVRRKIGKLEKKGWIVKNDQGEVFMSDTVSEHFTNNLNKRILTELLVTSKRIKELLASD